MGRTNQKWKNWERMCKKAVVVILGGWAIPQKTKLNGTPYEYASLGELHTSNGYQPAFCNFTWGEFVACAMQDQKKWNKSKIAEANCLQHLTWSICDLTSIPHIYTSGMSNTTEFFYRVGVTGIVSLRKSHEKWESLNKCSHGDLRNVFLSRCSVPVKGHQLFFQKVQCFLIQDLVFFQNIYAVFLEKSYFLYFERSSSLEDLQYVPKNCMVNLFLRM